jgi:hypothetical protein
LALGAAFHSTVTANFRQKIRNHRDAPMEEIQTLFDEELTMAIAEAELRDDEDVTELAAIGEAMLAVYMTEAHRASSQRPLRWKSAAKLPVSRSAVCPMSQVGSSTAKTQPGVPMGYPSSML